MEELDNNRHENIKEKLELIKDEFNIEIKIDELPDIWLSNHTIRLYLNSMYSEKEANKIMDFINSKK